MDISISKIKAVIEELRVVKSDLKKYIMAYENVMLECTKKENCGYEKLPFKQVLDDMNEEYNAMQLFIQTLEQIVDCYEKTEQKIVNNSFRQSGRNYEFKNIDFERIKGILDDYQIKFL